MAETFHHLSIKRARKARMCYWCAELIEIGRPYEQWRYKDGSDIGTVRMHPACQAACRQLSTDEGPDLSWSIGDFRRGSTEAR